MTRTNQVWTVARVLTRAPAAFDGTVWLHVPTTDQLLPMYSQLRMVGVTGPKVFLATTVATSLCAEVGAVVV
jgi:hypothetical protein